MNFFVFTVVVLIAIQEAYAIRCYQCQPDYASFAAAANKGNLSGLNLCNNPNVSVDCSQDPNIGNADACYTASVGLAYDISLLNLQGEIKFYVLGCAAKAGCNVLKTTTCDTLKSSFGGMPAGFGFNISQCDVSCCQRDGCNNPSGPPAPSPSGPPAPSPSGPPASSPSGPPAPSLSGPSATTTPASSVKSMHIPPNAAIFRILGLVTMAFMDLF